MDIGVFLPIGNNGWLISSTSPQYMPSFDLNREVTLKAEQYGFEFALSMIKLRGFGGPSQYWDHNLESFTLMAGLAAVTTRIKLFASVAVLTVPPALLARMAVTIDSISHGRFGVNIVSGWQKAEYEQMGIWPGERHFEKRYEYCSEYVQVMKDLWASGVSDFKGEFFRMTDCRVSPTPAAKHIDIIAAGQSNRGMQFAAEYADYNFISAGGINDISQVAPHTTRLIAANAAAGANCKAMLLMMIIADETDEAAMAKWHHYVAGTDLEALAWRDAQAGADVKAEAHSTVGRMVRSDRLPTNMLRLIGSYATVARQLDALAETPGLAGVMLTFDDFLIGMEQFGTRIQPLMQSRRHLARAAA
ncbi:pyrimidine monooxygenase RutA [Siccirubricoccus deserti]|uniref:Pyrimidine monooxygenase RutA n=1 Tax=Siccirubricoccus deserti TaxID=2013562 RepID=A0A9X0UFC4_9PROT|nr:pyrimidine utilization protein A [Siccirubricoccus deserti]MBC4017786.1 pyrimidine utilization protein A [Siccirubricoccus deserti]GGC61438.1 pyrimidine monooxygenase RutA [Siccirubricoccus deserti]